MISGFFDPARGPYPYLTVAVRVPFVTVDRWVSVQFIVDTGASHTAVHPLDAVRILGLTPAQLLNAAGWPKVVNSGGVGGGATYFECPAEYGFVRDDGSVEVIADDVWIGQLTPGSQRMPSLLGWNLLKHFRLEVNGGTPSIVFERL